jgi:hypothetical protein
MKRAVTVLFAPGFGQRPKQPKTFGGSKNSNSNEKCWGCGILGHKRGDPLCKAEAGAIHASAPERSKRKFNGNADKNQEGGPTVKKVDGLCRYFSLNDTCKFGAACKFRHENGGNGKPTKKARFSKKENKQVNALKATVSKAVQDVDQDAIDELVKGFLVVSTIHQGPIHEIAQTIGVLKTSLVDMDCFAYDTGAGEGISTDRNDCVYLDYSDSSKKSVVINGPSVGTPTCEGRGPLVHTFVIKGKLMGLVHINGIFASTNDESPEFRLASAMQMKRQGMRYVGGRFKAQDTIECVRTGETIPALDNGGSLIVKTHGNASDIADSIEFRQLVRDIDAGLKSPLFEVTKFLSASADIIEYVSKELSTLSPEQLTLRLQQYEKGSSSNVKVFLMNESKLSGEERARLYCRRFACCDPNIFRLMHGKEEYLPKLPILNEDNLVFIWKTKVEIRIHEPKRGFQAQKKYFLGRIRN